MADTGTGKQPALAARRALGLGVLVSGLLLVAGVAIGEWAGWPFLARPLQQALSDKLQRPVRFAVDAQSDARAHIRLIGSLRLHAGHLWIAAPSWSEAPHTLAAEEVSISLGYRDAWRAYRGGRLRIDTVKAHKLDAHLERDAQGRATWQTEPAARQEPSPAALPPLVGQLHVNLGRIRYVDVADKTAIEVQVSLREGASAGSGALSAQASGRYQGLPAHLEWASSGAMPLATDHALADPLQLRFSGRVGTAEFAFDGRAVDVLHLRALNGDFSLKGPSLAAVGAALGVTLPTTPPFRAAGKVARSGDVWEVDIPRATVGSSRLSGVFRYESARDVPLLSGRLGGARLMLADLGPVVGARSPGSGDKAARSDGKVLPTREFDLPSLRAMDAEVAIDLSEVDLNTELLTPLRPLRGQLRLQGGVLRIDGIEAATTGGALRGTMQLDGRGAIAAWSADLRWSDVVLERWIRQTREQAAPPYVSGMLNGHAKVSGKGRSTAQILASLDGDIRAHVRQGAISHLALETAGLDLAQMLGVMIRGDKQLALRCAVADLQVLDGIARPRVMVLDTADSIVFVSGSASFVDEALDLRMVVTPRDFSPLALRTPVRIRGRFADPQVQLEPGPLGVKLASALLLGLINPLAALIPLVDTGAPEETRSCAELAGAKPVSTASGPAPSGRTQNSTDRNRAPAQAPAPVARGSERSSTERQ